VKSDALDPTHPQHRQPVVRQLDRASQSGGDITPFVVYAVQGFVDGLREQLRVVRDQQFEDRWEQYIYETFGEARSPAARRQRQLVLELSKQDGKPVTRPKLRTLTPGLAEAYAGKTSKTLSRDINALVDLGLIERVPGGYRARREQVLAFLPLSTAEGLD